MFSTKKSGLEKLADRLGINKRFHRFSESYINRDKDIIISPVDAKVVCLGEIKDRKVISKYKRLIGLDSVIEDDADKFGSYINLYLSPKNRHFWVTPYSGRFTNTYVNEGSSRIKVLIALENLPVIGKYMGGFEAAVKKNASIGSILETDLGFPVAMIAVGSLNVNGIHTEYIPCSHYEKGFKCGYFSIGSSMLLCFPEGKIEYLVKEGQKVKIGEAIAKIKY